MNLKKFRYFPLCISTSCLPEYKRIYFPFWKWRSVRGLSLNHYVKNYFSFPLFLSIWYVWNVENKWPLRERFQVTLWWILLAWSHYKHILKFLNHFCMLRNTSMTRADTLRLCCNCNMYTTWIFVGSTSLKNVCYLFI